MVGVRIPLLIVCAGLDDALIVPGMAVATSVSYLVGAIVGEIWLRARFGPMGTRRTLVTLLKMTVAGGAGAAAALLAANRLLQFEVDDLGEAVLQILLSGTVGLLVIAAVAILLRVEELAPLRQPDRRPRSAASGDAVRPNPGAASGVKDTGGGTLAGDTYSAADVAGRRAGQSTEQSPAASRWQQRPSSIFRHFRIRAAGSRWPIRCPTTAAARRSAVPAEIPRPRVTP